MTPPFGCWRNGAEAPFTHAASGLREEDDAGLLRRLVDHAEQGVETVLGLHRVDVVPLLHDLPHLH